MASNYYYITIRRSKYLSNGGFENGLNTWQSFGSDISQITNPKRSEPCIEHQIELWNGMVLEAH